VSRDASGPFFDVCSSYHRRWISVKGIPRQAGVDGGIDRERAKRLVTAISSTTEATPS
jgi:hypothetical protein